MKRIQMCKKVNTNNTFNHVNRKLTHLNAVSPEILVGQIWLQDEPTGVEIIELNTSDELDPSTAKALDTLHHAWSYTNNEKLQQIEDNYKINNRARERRRLNHFQTTNTATNTSNHLIDNNLYSDIVENLYIEDSQLLNNKENCFTMINKHFINSDTSSDADIDLITPEDLTMECNSWDEGKHPYEEEIITFDHEAKEPRTIWIYSFKNKHLLAEDDCEVNATATTDMSFYSTSSSTERDEEKTKDKSTNIRRLGSPIPPSYIPRLNLTLGPTLSTVSEVSEPNKQTSPKLSYKSPKTRFQKQKNSWVMTEKLDPPSDGKLEKSTNVINWMALSPREKRRRSNEQGDKWMGSILNMETVPFQESNEQQTQDKSEQENALRLQVDVDVHVSVNENTPEKRTPNSANVILKPNTDKNSPIALLKCAPMNIKGDALDRGDHMKFGQTQQVLCFSGPSHIYETMRFNETLHMRRAGDITVIEDRGYEISPEAYEREQKLEIETASYDYETKKLKLANKNPDRTWLKNNAPFLVPSSWADYAETAERSSLSIQMSNRNVSTIRDPWYKRFFKIINCFK